MRLYLLLLLLVLVLLAADVEGKKSKGKSKKSSGKGVLKGVLKGKVSKPSPAKVAKVKVSKKIADKVKKAKPPVKKREESKVKKDAPKSKISKVPPVQVAKEIVSKKIVDMIKKPKPLVKKRKESKEKKDVKKIIPVGKTPIIADKIKDILKMRSKILKGGKSKESGGKSAKKGGKSVKRGGKSKESGGKSSKKGGKSKESGGKSIKRGGKSKESGGKSMKRGGKSKESGGKSMKRGGKSKEKGGKSIKRGGKSKESGGKSMKRGGKSKESGGKSMKRGGKSKEKGGKSIKRGGKSKESGGKSMKRGGKSKERGGKSMKRGGKSKEKGGKSIKRGGKSKESGGKSSKKGGKSKENGGKSIKRGGKSKEKGGKSIKRGGKSKESGGKSKGKGGKSKESGGKSKKSGGKSQKSGGKSKKSGGKSKKSGGKSKKSGGKSKKSGGKSKDSKSKSKQSDISDEETGNEGPTKVTLCENSQRTITCPPGSNLRIFSAFFGRSNRKVCRGTIRTLRCSSKNALAKARGLCDGRQSCNVRASVSVFGDPCRGTSKYLEVSYACQTVSPQPPKPPQTPVSYLGCYEDRRVRLLDQQFIRMARLTISACKELCRKRKKKYAGVEHGNECFCGDNMKKYPKRPEKECSYPCSGNPKEKCGASWRISVYQVNTPESPCAKCAKNARCVRGKCTCNRGYHGDGINSCQKSCFCMASGDPHYKTYDGEMIHFMGTCKYTLTRSTTSNDACGFHVIVKNEHRNKNTRVSYTRRVTLKILGKKIGLRQKGVVMVDGERKFLPVSELGGKLKVFRSGRFVQVTTSCGVTVNFDGVHAVSVTVPGKYRGQLTGLCGDCNGKRDDMRTSTGRDVSREKLKYSLIGNSYEVAGDSDDSEEKCKTVEDPNTFTCSKRMNVLMATDAYCGLINKKSGPFAECIAKFPAISKEYFESCRIDVCSMEGADLQVAKCEALEAFAEECADNGVTVTWRSKRFCPLKCPDRNSEYRASGPGCPATCLDPKAEDSCMLEPQEGCFCKRGYLLSDGACVPKTQCGCRTKNGDYYPVGARLQSTDCGSVSVCRNRGGKPDFVKLSGGQRCHKDATCRLNKDGERTCICNKGFRGDGIRTCKPIVVEEPECGGKCSKNAVCRGDKCVCKRGFRGDGINCDKVTVPECGGKSCADNARCKRGKCVCKRGFHGDGYNSCTKSCFCMASGDPHYKTYDGEMIHFMGTCKYTLTRSTTSNDTCGFHVIVKNEHRNKNTRVSFTRRVTLKILGKKIGLRQKGLVMIDGEKKFLPVNELGGKLKVFRSGRFVQVTTSCGVTMNFDGVHAVSVTVPGKYRGQLTGLCGDCNGKRDDMRTSTGRDVSREKLKYSLIGNSYELAGGKDGEGEKCKTEDDTPYVFTCDAKMSNLLATDKYCGWIQSKEGPFAECISKFPTISKEYFESCRIDVCSLEGENLDVAKCEALEAFAEECADNGVTVTWRSKRFCPLKCEDKNAEYRSSGPGCPATCLDPDAEDTCTLEPTEGCFCKAGFVLSDGACVPRDQCGCKNDKGDYFPVGTKIQASTCAQTYECKRVRGKTALVKTSSGQRCHRKADCVLDDNGERKCVCKDGFFGDGYKSCQPLCGGKYRCHKNAVCKKGRCQCRRGLFGDGENSCEKMCTCSASGDPHYRTYDGQMIHFMGVCKYTMTKSLTKNDPCSFSVEVKNEHRGRNRRVAYTRAVDVRIYGKLVRLAPGHKVYVDGVRKFLPVSENKGDLKIVMSGRFVQLITKCNVYVNWDGKSVVQVGVPRSYSKKMEGICGNCDGRKNDYKTKDGVDVYWRKNKYVLIGRSYEVPDDSDKPTKICKTFEDDVQCSEKMKIVATNKNHCGYLNPKTRRSSPFNICLASKPTLAKQMFESCIYDVCSYFDDVKKRTEAACRAAEGLEAICETSGFDVQWRSSSFCPIQCGANQRYSYSVSGCPATCTTPNAPDSCPLPNTEGCECLPGFVLSGTRCVRETECGCQAPNGDYIPLNTIIVSDDCTSTKKCVSRNGEAIFEDLGVNERCHPFGMCGLKDGIRQCVCKEGYSGDGVNQCKKLCGGKYLCHENARCDNGICQCNSGLFGDGITSCQESCTCMATGDPHYRTFDGQMIHFMGECKYTLSKFDSTDNCAFNVEVKNVKRHENARVSFTRLVDVKVPGFNIRLLQKRRLTINGVQTFTPWSSPNGVYKVTAKGRYLTVTTSCGVVVSFDGVHAVSLSVPRQYGDSLTGLCGNCNRKKDDLTTKTGEDVSKKPNKFSMIGDSYKVFDDVANPGEKCATTDHDFTCSSLWSRRAASKEFCGVLLDKTGPFGSCIKANEDEARDLYQSCIDDVCSYEDTPDFAMKTACMAGESLAELCLTKGLGKVVWRRSDFCPMDCPDNSVYSPAIVGCPRTCADPEAETQCEAIPQEGCQCKEGYVLSGEKCVIEDECGCFYNDQYYPLNSLGPLTNCEIIQKCTREGGTNKMVLTTRQMTCHQNARCRSVMGEFQCRCNRGYEGDGVARCTRTEEPEEELPFLPEPPSGTPGEKCQVQTTYSTCGSTIKLIGNCEYNSDVLAKCQYTIATASTEGETKAVISTRGRRTMVPRGKTVEECVTVTNEGSYISISDDVCQRCTADYLRSLIPNQTCKAP
ncbi:zonadhesin-like isoform X2 [Crassostrea virginica]